MSRILQILTTVLVLASAQPCFHAYALGGFPVWTNVFDRGGAAGSHLPAAVAVGGNGTIFVTGESSATYGNPDFATLAYSRSGACLWTNIYNGTNGYVDAARDLAVDASGNVYVTGGTYLIGNTKPAIATIKYSQSGTPIWTNFLSLSVNGGESSVGIVVDSNSDAIVAGYYRGSSSVLNNNYVTVKYSSAGSPLWTNRFSGPGQDYDQVSAIGIDAGNNVYVTGSSISTDWKDYLTIKYTSSGVALWTNRFNVAADTVDTANAMVVSPNGTAYITGDTTTYNINTTDYLTIALSGSGSVLWSQRYGNGYGADVPTAIGRDDGGNVFITGYSAGDGTGLDYATVKYAESGTPLWTNRYTGPGTFADRAYALAVDVQGNVFVTGSSEINSVSSVIVTVAYSGTGIPLWTNFHRNPDPSMDYSTATGTAIAVDGEGEVYAVGGASVRGSSYDYVTIRYSSLTPTPIPLKIATTADSTVLTWSNAAYGLQSTPSLITAFTNMPGAASPYTNPITEPQRFFRLNAR